MLFIILQCAHFYYVNNYTYRTFLKLIYSPSFYKFLIYSLLEFKFDCGTIFTDSFGQFKPGDLDGDTQYDNNLDCLWIILASENKTTYVELYNFDIEREEQCSFDYLKVLQ